MISMLTFGPKAKIVPSVATEPTKEVQQKNIEAQVQQEQLWATAAQKGDHTAFMKIVEAYQRPVYNLCYRMLGAPTEAEDAAQETFLRAYTKIKSYNPNRKLSSWLLSIASHYCIDRLRRRKYQKISFDELPPWRWLPDTQQPQPEEAVLTDERHETLHQMLDSLPGDYRAALILRYWYEMSYDEIAETLETTVSAIKSRLYRGRKMMAEKYPVGAIE